MYTNSKGQDYPASACVIQYSARLTLEKAADVRFTFLCGCAMLPLN
jgi:hypothetical protein